MGTSNALNFARDQLRRFARTSAPVLVRGESGTGKELAAAEVHAGSGRRGPLVALNCGALPESLAPSQLFGHARGAFTGAVSHHRGAFARADHGTLFLDEIGELPLPSQALLLRVLETGRVCPVGSESETTIDAKVVCATHRDLADMVARGTFREDLFHRLAVLTVEMPPLRARPCDVGALLDHFAAAFTAEVGTAVQFTDDARALAQTAPWPGNVRELRNAVQRAALLAEGAPITASMLLPSASQGARGPSLTIPRGTFITMRQALLRAVVDTEGSIRKAAAVLEIPRSTLGSWLLTGS